MKVGVRIAGKASVKQTLGTGTPSVFVELYFGRCATGSVCRKNQILRSTGVKGVGEVTNSPSRADCSLLSLLMVTDLTPPIWRSTKMPFSRLRRAAPVSTVVPLVSLCFSSLRRLVTSLQSKFFDPLFILSPTSCRETVRLSAAHGTSVRSIFPFFSVWFLNQQ